MLRFLLRRIALIIPTFIGISVLAFSFIRLLPGDPIDVLSGERSMSPERRAALVHQFGLDRPIWDQYFEYVWRVLHGDLGTSISNAHPVVREFFSLFPATVELSLCAMLRIQTAEESHLLTHTSSGSRYCDR
jgi:dipeptide transport system permease protein